MKRSIQLMLVCLLTGLVAKQAHAFGGTRPGEGHSELPTVQSVDLNRYLGKWYEIARITQVFEEGCVAVTAEYSLDGDGDIAVKNSCRKERLDGELKVAHGTAKIVDTLTNSKLKVSFFWPFYGPYWILELGADYEYAVVGSPDRETLWILSRSPRMDNALVDAILARRAAQGFDVSKVDRVEQ